MTMRYSGASCFIQPTPIRDSEIAHQVAFFLSLPSSVTKTPGALL